MKESSVEFINDEFHKPIVMAIIPARSGSKGIPDKNIKPFIDKPLIAWSIEHAKKSKYIDRVILSTNSKKIAEIGKEYGAEVPFYRPDEISQDLSTDFEFMDHCMKWFKENEPETNFKLIVQLRPTYPIRRIHIIDECIEFMLNNQEYDSLRTVIELDKPAYKMYKISDNSLVPLFDKFEYNNMLVNHPYNLPRQLLPKTYWHNGYLDIIKPSVLENGDVTGEKIYPMILNKGEIYDIDTLEEWRLAEKYVTS